MARSRKQPKKIFNRILFVGWGVLGKATARLVAERFVGTVDSPTFDIIDPALKAIPRANILTREKHPVNLELITVKDLADRLIDVYDAIFVCVPSNELDSVLTQIESTTPQVLTVVRTTMPLEYVDEYAKWYSGMVYFPEYAREQQMRSSYITEFGPVWAFDLRTQHEFVQLMGNTDSGLTFYPQLAQVAAHKLMSNAYLATLYSFKNEAARFYRDNNISKPVPIYFGRAAARVFQEPMESAVSVSGKCLPYALKQLAGGMDHPNFFEDVHSFNQEAISSLAARVNFYVSNAQSNTKGKSESKTASKWNRINVLGLSSVKGDPSAPINKGQVLDFIRQCRNAHPSLLSPASQLRELSIEPKPNKKPISSADIYGEFVILMQGYPTMVSDLKRIMQANMSMGKNKLTILDPLGLLNGSRIRSLHGHSDTLDRAGPFLLKHVVTI